MEILDNILLDYDGGIEPPKLQKSLRLSCGLLHTTHAKPVDESSLIKKGYCNVIFCNG